MTAHTHSPTRPPPRRRARSHNRSADPPKLWEDDRDPVLSLSAPHRPPSAPDPPIDQRRPGHSPRPSPPDLVPAQTHPRSKRYDALHSKYASEGCEADPEHHPFRRMASISRPHAWQSVRRHVSDAAHAAAAGLHGGRRQSHAGVSNQLASVPASLPVSLPHHVHSNPHHAHSHSYASTASSPPASALSSAASDTLFTTTTTTSSRAHTLARLKTSVHHYQPSDTSSPGRGTLPLSPLPLPLSPQGIPMPQKSPTTPATFASSLGTSVGRFRASNIDEVLPFATSPFAAWDPVAVAEASGSSLSAPSVSGSRASVGVAGWHESHAAAGTRRTWRDDRGRDIATVYKLGWEREVLDLEARLHEAMYDLAGGRHTFVSVDSPPATVLDLGTGSGLWPLAQARQWPEAQFVAADLVPCHIDAHMLAQQEKAARTSSAGEAAGLGTWASVADRVSFQQFNFLEGLPFDSGVFDMVHLRFLGLAVPETRWADLLDEAVRVLRPGGVLEIVEMSVEPPPTAPRALVNAFASRMLSDYIPHNPLLALQLHLPATAALSAGHARPVFSAAWPAASAASGAGTSAAGGAGTSAGVSGGGGASEEWSLSDGAAMSRGPSESFGIGSGSVHGLESPTGIPAAFADAGRTWLRSALEYRGTYIAGVRGSEMGIRAVEALRGLDAERWGVDAPLEREVGRGRVCVAAWVACKT